MPLLTKQVYSGTQAGWKRNTHFLKIQPGIWKITPQIYVKTSTGWKPLYSFSWNLGPWSACSKACGGGIQTRTVTCKRDDGVTLPDSVCASFVGDKPTTEQVCNTQSCTYYWMGHSDDYAALYIYNDATAAWEGLWGGRAPGETTTLRAITSNLFSNGGVMKMAFLTQDLNGTSYSASLRLCTDTNTCTPGYIVYYPNQGECDGAAFWFTWDIDTMTTNRVRCAYWNAGKDYTNCTESCSACTDAGWGYLNCNSGAPAWAYTHPEGDSHRG